MARVDSLPDAAKEVLQAGSAIEREFSYELIKAVTELPGTRIALSSLCSQGRGASLRTGIFPQSTFVFKHALTREVVYDSILAKRRKLLHEKIGTPSRRFIATISVIIMDFGRAFSGREGYEKAAKYAKLASKKAEKTASLNDAILYAEKGIACLEKLPVNDEVQKKIIDAQNGFGLLSDANESIGRKAKEPVIDLAAKRR